MARNRYNAELIEGFAKQFRRRAEVLQEAADLLPESPLSEVTVNFTAASLDQASVRRGNFVGAIHSAVTAHCWTAPPPPKKKPNKKSCPRGAA